MAADRRVLVVCSAVTQVSNKLEDLLSSALAGNHAPALQELEEIHRRLSKDLAVDFTENLQHYFKQLNQLAEGVSLIGEVTPRIHAQVLAFGELMSTALGVAFLKSQQLTVDWQDARQLLIAEPQPFTHHSAAYLMARCKAEPDANLMAKLQLLTKVVITQGFIASNPAGETVLIRQGRIRYFGGLFRC